MLKCDRRRVVNQLLRAFHSTEAIAADGSLPSETWQWILWSRLIFFAKKASATTRPVKVGEP